MTTFMDKLEEHLITVRKVAPSSAKNYLRNLRLLNDNRPFNSLGFLRKKDMIGAKLSSLTSGTRRNYLISIITALSPHKEQKSYASLYKHYHTLMLDTAKSYKDEQPKSGEKSDKQRENGIEMDKVMEIWNELKSKVDAFSKQKSKELSVSQYDDLLSLVILSLYVLQSPRRNKDYTDMMIVKTLSDDHDKSKNYLVINDEEFVFNAYKTAKNHGQQRLSFKDNDRLKQVINIYLKFHPLAPARLSAMNTPIAFLVGRTGSPLRLSNQITRVLNKVFGKRVGSSMLRHIYLSDKFGNVATELENTTREMGHTTGEALNTYIKKE